MEFAPYLLNIAVIHLLMAMVPGPNTVVVGYCSAAISREAGFKASVGIVLASLVWVSFSLFGVGLLLMQAGQLFTAMRIAGAFYLIYVGVRMLRPQGPKNDGSPPHGISSRSPFLAGFLTTLSNPKSAVFWTSVFTLVLPASAPGWFYASILVVVAAQASLWYGAVALTLSTRVSRRYYERLAQTLTRLAGGCMLFFGLKLANELRLELARRAL